MGSISFPTTGRLIGILSLALSTALAVLPCASAADATFTGTGVAADWLTPGNWSTGAVPISGDTATVTGGLDASLTGGSSSIFALNVSGNSNVTVSGAAASLNVAYSGTYGVVNVGILGSGSLAISNGASVNLTSSFMYLGAGTGDAGTVSVTGATLQFTGGNFPLVVGSGTNSVGTLYVGNGALVAPSLPADGSGYTLLADSVGSTGTVIQTGGTFSTMGLFYGSGTAVYRLEGGTLLVSQITTRYTGSAQGAFTFELASGTVQSKAGSTSLDNFVVVNLRQGTTSTLDTSGGSMNVQSVITGSGALNVSGTSTLTLGGTNTYSGGTTMTQGSLDFLNGSALGSGTLTFAGNSTLVGGSSSITIANNIQINSGVTASTSLTFGTVLAGVISGSGAFDMFGGSLSFTGSNTFTGGLILEGSANLTFSSSNSLGKGAVTMRGATLTWASGNTDDISSLVTLDSGVAIFNTNGNTVTFASALQGGGNFNKAGGGTLILSASNSFTGNIAMSGGTLRIANPDAIVNSGTLVFSGGSFEGNGTPLTVANALLFQAGTFSGNSDLNFTGRVDFGSSIRTLGVSNTGTTTFSGSLVGTGAGGFLKQGAGVLVISGTNNTYTGRTSVNAGTLVVTSLADIGVASSLGAPTSAANGTIGLTSILNYVGAGNSSNRSFSLGGVGTIDSSGSGALVLSGSVTSALGATAKTLVLAGTNTALNTLSGTISNGATATVSFEKAGTGTWLLSGNNTYTGTTTISGGLLMASNVSTGSNNLGAGTSAVILGGAATSGTLAYTGNSATYTRGFSVNAGGGGLSVATAGQTLTLGTNGVATGGLFTVSGSGNTAIGTSISGTGSLQKSGAGQLALSGSNSFGGGTLVTGGTVSVQSNNALGTGGVKVGGGVLSVEQGSGVANAVSLAGGRYDRTLSGSLTDAVNASSDLGGVNTTARLAAGTLSSTSTLDTLFSASSAATNDGIRRSDVYSFVGTGGDLFVLELSFSSTASGSSLGWLSGSEWVNAVDGNTGNNATVDMLNYNGSYAAFQVAYGATLENYVGAYGTSIDGGVTTAWAVLNHNSDFAVIPEPGTVGLLAVGGAILLLRRRRVC